MKDFLVMLRFIIARLAQVAAQRNQRALPEDGACHPALNQGEPL
jgi:hypothetical protein